MTRFNWDLHNRKARALRGQLHIESQLSEAGLRMRVDDFKQMLENLTCPEVAKLEPKKILDLVRQLLELGSLILANDKKYEHTSLVGKSNMIAHDLMESLKI